ncbi:MAG: type II secretion protein ATPase [Alphaproteobacteria bacterium]|jgi:pilus assembly protein CpaE|nr:type II secretion protein ATPase [Alphaproteobacteria bacterium]MDP7223071.1 type II secretion protein ATPase [Alphaproteobacteria bacterium]
MGAEKKAHISTLLPQARITLFTQDDTTRGTFESIADDWRFARVKMDAQDGDVNDAIRFYAEYESPDLIIVQTDNIDDHFPALLEDLATNCREGTAAIVIGPVNDVNLYRQLVGMGVSDYLVRPLDKEVFANDIAGTLLEKLGESGSRLIACVGAKGGVGVSSMAQAAATISAETLGQKTFLLDAAAGWSTLSVGMDFEPSTTMQEAVQAAVDEKQDSFSRMILEKTDKLSVLSSAGDPMLENDIDADGYETLLEQLMVTYPVVVVDLSACTPEIKKAVLARANSVLLVTTAALTSVRATRTLLQEVKRLRGDSDEDVRILLNMQGMAGKTEVPKAQIEEGLEKALTDVVPFEPSLFPQAEAQGALITHMKAAKNTLQKLENLVVDLIGDRTLKKESADKGADGKKPLLGAVLSGLKKN